MGQFLALCYIISAVAQHNVVKYNETWHGTIHWVMTKTTDFEIWNLLYWKMHNSPMTCLAVYVLLMKTQSVIAICGFCLLEIHGVHSLHQVLFLSQAFLVLTLWNNNGVNLDISVGLLFLGLFSCRSSCLLFDIRDIKDCWRIQCTSFAQSTQKIK